MDLFGQVGVPVPPPGLDGVVVWAGKENQKSEKKAEAALRATGSLAECRVLISGYGF